jgi:hypothetical protein
LRQAVRREECKSPNPNMPSVCDDLRLYVFSFSFLSVVLLSLRVCYLVSSRLLIFHHPST